MHNFKKNDIVNKNLRTNGKRVLKLVISYPPMTWDLFVFLPPSKGFYTLHVCMCLVNIDSTLGFNAHRQEIESPYSMIKCTCHSIPHIRNIKVSLFSVLVLDLFCFET